MKEFSERLKELRNEKGLTQREIAKIFEIDNGSYALWELGGETSFEMLVKIAKFFNVSTDYLLGVVDF